VKVVLHTTTHSCDISSLYNSFLFVLHQKPNEQHKHPDTVSVKLSCHHPHSLKRNVNSMYGEECQMSLICVSAGSVEVIIPQRASVRRQGLVGCIRHAEACGVTSDGLWAWGILYRRDYIRFGQCKYSIYFSFGILFSL